MNKTIISSPKESIQHYGIKGMKWDEEKTKTKTTKLKTLVNNTVAIKDEENPKALFQRIVTDEDIAKVEKKVQREKEDVTRKIAKAEAFLKKQKDIESSTSLVKILATDSKRKAVGDYVNTLKNSEITLNQLTTQLKNRRKQKHKDDVRL